MLAKHTTHPANANKPAAATTPTESGAQLTTTPVQAADLSNVQPEFCRVNDLRHLYGIRRGHAYSLIHDGEIRSVSVRRRGYKQGVRLVDVASVRDYLNRLAQEPTFATKEGTVTE